MTPMFEAPGAPLAYHERGDGRAVVLVHGMADDSERLSGLVGELAREARVLTYDRRGYGASGAPEVYERTSVQEQAEDAAALLRGAGASPAAAWGADFGALVVLDLLVRHPDLVEAAVLLDPPVFALVPEATEALSAERLMLEEALRDAGPEGAVESWLAARAPEASADRVTRARRAHAAFFADLGGLASWPAGRRELRGIGRPVGIAVAARAPAHVQAAATALAALLPDAAPAPADPVAAVREVLRRV
jgi:pimeloyl-ACP methyl ester carboxylesterase